MFAEVIFLHSPVEIINKNADTALLFVHGIVGTPRHFDDFVNIAPKDVSILNILLDGHGKGVKEFSKTCMKKWEAQVDNAINTLALTHDNIYIVAHSMGTLFALNQAKTNKKIKGLFLLSVPLKLKIKPKMLTNVFKVYFNKIKPDDLIAQSAKRCYGIIDSKNPFNYLGWIPRYLELFIKAKDTRKIITDINIPVKVFQSKNDEMVSLKTIEILNKNSNIKVTVLENSCHYYYDTADLEFLLNEFKKIKA